MLRDAKLPLNTLVQKKLFPSCFGVVGELFRDFCKVIAQCLVGLRTCVKSCYYIVDCAWREVENRGYARGIDVVGVEKFYSEMSCIDYLGSPAAGQDLFFWYICFIADNLYHSVSKVGDL